MDQFKKYNAERGKRGGMATWSHYDGKTYN